jgi:hypothetical protein
MELLLNLVWLAIAVGAVVAYLRAPWKDRRQFRLGLGALLCILTLLLPAISITDDLHFEACAVEDSSPTKRLVNAAASATPASNLVWFIFSFLALFWAALRSKTWLRTERTCDLPLHSQFRQSILGRAPPFVLA